MKKLLLFALLLSASLCHSQKIEAKGETLDEKLFVAAQAQDVARIRSLLARGADPNAGAKEGNSIVEFVVANRDLTAKRAQILRLLLAAGADLNAADRNGNTPLTEAAWDLKTFQLLLDAPARRKVDLDAALVLAAYH